jgi:hypothetical protein
VQGKLCEVLQLMRTSGVLLCDEIDLLLHPLRSELVGGRWSRMMMMMMMMMMIMMMMMMVTMIVMVTIMHGLMRP